MKRSAPPQGILKQKKIRTYMIPSTTPLVLYECKRANPLTPELRYAMRHAIQYQLETFKEAQPLVCVFDSEHQHTEYVASHYIRYFDDLCNAFLKMFSSFRLPGGYDITSSGFLVEDAVFEKAWSTFHQKRANLRILCRSCHMECVAPQYGVKKAKTTHPWLSLNGWGEPTEKGNYSRKLANKPFTVFQRDNKWRYAYNNKFSDTSYDTAKQAIEASYLAFGETIRRYG